MGVSAACDEGRQICNFPARRRRRGEDNLVRVEAFRRDPAGYFLRNRGRRPGGGARGRGEVVGGEKRGLKCPPHQPLLLYAGHRRAGGGGGTRIFVSWGQDFAAPLKNF